MTLNWPEFIPSLSREERDALYPVDDDEPMTSSLPHYQALTYAVETTRYHLREADCLVAGDFAVYYEPLPPGARGPGPSVVPDLLVAFGVELDRNTSYCLWEVGKVPDLVMEMTSKTTWEEDQFNKHHLYAQLEVPEYWQYDPHGEYLSPRLMGWELAGDVYRPIKGLVQPELGAELFFSNVLDTSWGRLLDSSELRLWNPQEQNWYPAISELQADRLKQVQRAKQEAQRAEREASARRAAEAELAQLKERLKAMSDDS